MSWRQRFERSHGVVGSHSGVSESLNQVWSQPLSQRSFHDVEHVSEYIADYFGFAHEQVLAGWDDISIDIQV